jgi:hypothetical protein
MSEGAVRMRKRIWIVPSILTAIVAALWAFPSFWYVQRGEGKLIWFGEKTDLPGWKFATVPVGESAEKLLVADHIVNGEFLGPEQADVRAFSAKRYAEKANEIGLFVHTPDRCWVEAGWQIEPTAPDAREIELYGAKIPVERRVFAAGGNRELVYFFGLVGGRPLPYRLDHNLSVGMRSTLRDTTEKESAARTDKSMARASDAHFWERLWDSFKGRREFTGPKQFVRISTPIRSEDIGIADKCLEKFLEQWLVPADYESERAHWETTLLTAK